MKELTPKKFDQSLQTSKLVVICFMATWCGPCKEMMNTISQVEDKYSDWAKFYKIDFDKDRTLFDRFHVGSVPTLIVFKNGCPIYRQSGSMPEVQFEQKIEILIKRQSHY